MYVIHAVSINIFFIFVYSQSFCLILFMSLLSSSLKNVNQNTFNEMK